MSKKKPSGSPRGDGKKDSGKGPTVDEILGIKR